MIAWNILWDAQAWFCRRAAEADELARTVERIRGCHNVHISNVDSYHEGRPEEEGRFPYTRELEHDPKGRYAQPSYLAGGSDYDNMGMVGVANLESWEEAFGESMGEWWDIISGGYGHQSVIIDLHHPGIPEEAANIINGLDSYCLIDDELHSDLQMKDQLEQWDDYGRRELLEAMRDAYGMSENAWFALEDIPDEKVDEAFSFACGHEGSYPEGDGGNVSWPWSGRGLPIAQFLIVVHSQLQGNASPN